MYTSVGKREFRRDAEGKVTGKTLYGQDIYIKGALYGRTLRSKMPHAYINIDITSAEKIEGVIKIFTAKDVTGKNEHGVVFKDHEVFCEKKVRRIGDPIAFVVAENEEIARKGMEAIKVEYKELPAVFDPIEAMKEGAPQVHDGQSNNIYHFKIRKGNIEEGFKNSDLIVENTYKTNMVDHAFLQPEGGISYIEKGKIVVCVSTQYPHFDRLEISEALGLPEEKIRVLNPAVGGAFGGREDITMQIHLALATNTLKRPVRTVYDRAESFYAHSKRHSFIMKYKTGVTKDGRIVANEVEIIGDTGAYASWVCNVMRKGGIHATGPYEIPNVKVDSYGVYTNNPFAGAKRGFGATQPPVAYEQQMDIIAEKLGISSTEIRFINMFRKGSKTATGQELTDSVVADKCLEAVLEKLKRK